MNLSKNVKISSAVTPTAGAAGTDDINGSTLDMAGYEGVLVVVRMGAITTNAVTSIKMQQDSDSAMGSAADLAGTSQAIADSDDGEIFYIDLFRPEERYVRLVVDRGTQNAVVASAEYIQYGPKAAPVTQPSGTNGETHVSPAEGTA